MLMIKNIVQCLKCKRNRYKVIYKDNYYFLSCLGFYTTQLCSPYTVHVYIYLAEHLGPSSFGGFVGGAVHTHGFPVTGEL